MDLFEGFYSGSKSIEDVMAEFDILVGKIHELDYEMNVAAKEDTEHYGKIVSSVYQRFKFHLVQQAFCANHTEGKQIADQYGMPGNRNFAYYNSPFIIFIFLSVAFLLLITVCSVISSIIAISLFL